MLNRNLIWLPFRKNFIEKWERAGAAFAVYHKGKLVVDLWGGYADTSCNRLWNEDTITVIFSCTKVRGCVDQKRPLYVLFRLDPEHRSRCRVWQRSAWRCWWIVVSAATTTRSRSTGRSSGRTARRTSPSRWYSRTRSPRTAAFAPRKIVFGSDLEWKILGTITGYISTTYTLN